VFDASRHPQIKTWYGSYQRNKYAKTPFGQMAEKLARQVGDQVDLWAVTQGPLSIVGAKLQQLTPQGWVDRVRLFKEQGELMLEEFGGVNTTKIINDSVRMRKVLFG
jgi:hypothetical protein